MKQNVRYEMICSMHISFQRNSFVNRPTRHTRSCKINLAALVARTQLDFGTPYHDFVQVRVIRVLILRNLACSHDFAGVDPKDVQIFKLTQRKVHCKII